GGDGHDHSHGHSHSHNHSHDVEDPNGMSLFGFIDTGRVRCLNEGQPGEGVGCLKAWDKREELEPHLESNDGDPELLIYIPFTEVVKIKAICVRGGSDGSAPSGMKVWVNRDDIDFSNAPELPPVQNVETVEGQSVVEYPAKISKMQNVSDITLFFPDNFGADQTIINFIGFKGENTNIRHGVVECVYEASAQLQDHELEAKTGQVGAGAIL
ncbi:unnamed protein product, partial [Chrysoparadoxa australica]